MPRHLPAPAPQQRWPWSARSEPGGEGRRWLEGTNRIAVKFREGISPPGWGARKRVREIVRTHRGWSAHPLMLGKQDSDTRTRTDYITIFRPQGRMSMGTSSGASRPLPNPDVYGYLLWCL